jgi:centromeric protein E
MKDLNSRIEQLTKLILTSASVDDAVRDHDGEGGGSQPESPIKIDFDMSPYQLQQELLAARLQIETQAHQILSLEASLLARSHATGEVPGDAAPEEKDRVIAEQARTIRELESYEEKKSTGVVEDMEVELRRVRDEIEMEWEAKFEEERKVREEKERWADEVVKAFEKEKKTRVKLEEERRALAAFVSKFDSLVLGSDKSSAENMSKAKVKLGKPLGIPSPGGSAMSTYERRQSRRSFSGLSAYTRLPRISDVTVKAELESEWDPVHPNMDGISQSQDVTGSTFMLESDSEAEARDTSSSSPFRLDHHQRDVRMQMQADALNAPRLLDQAIPEEVENCMLNLSFDECEVEEQLLQVGDGDMSVCFFEEGAGGLTGLGISVNSGGKVPPSEKREVLGNKENLVK